MIRGIRVLFYKIFGAEMIYKIMSESVKLRRNPCFITPNLHTLAESSDLRISAHTL